MISNSVLSRLEREYLNKEEDFKDQIASLTNKIRSLKTENILKENKIVTLQSKIKRLEAEFSQLNTQQHSEQANTQQKEPTRLNHQQQVDHNKHISLENSISLNTNEKEILLKESSLNKFKEDLSSFKFDKNLEFSNERFKILTQQTEILLNLNKQLDLDSLVYENENEHLTIEEFKKKFPDQSTIEILQNSNIKLESYNQNISRVVEQTKNIIKVPFVSFIEKRFIWVRS